MDRRRPLRLKTAVSHEALRRVSRSTSTASSATESERRADVLFLRGLFCRRPYHKLRLLDPPLSTLLFWPS